MCLGGFFKASNHRQPQECVLASVLPRCLESQKAGRFFLESSNNRVYLGIDPIGDYINPIVGD